MKRIEVVGANPQRVKVSDEPKRRIDPAELAAQLGADANGKYLGANLDPIALAELATKRCMIRTKIPERRPFNKLRPGRNP